MQHFFCFQFFFDFFSFLSSNQLLETHTFIFFFSSSFFCLTHFRCNLTVIVSTLSFPHSFDTQQTPPSHSFFFLAFPKDFAISCSIVSPRAIALTRLFCFFFLEKPAGRRFLTLSGSLFFFARKNEIRLYLMFYCVTHLQSIYQIVLLFVVCGTFRSLLPHWNPPTLFLLSFSLSYFAFFVF